jgi:RNA polymerase primary sigma factor
VPGWAADHDELLRSASRGDRKARAQLLEINLPLVRGVASRYHGAGLPFDDLVQEGSVGLLEAIGDFDPRLGVEFAAYARFRVHRAIRNALTERARLVRLPKHIVERRRLIDRERARVFASSGHVPSATELAERTGLPLDTVLATLGAGIDAVSLDAPVTPDGSSLEELVADPAAVDPEAVVVERDSVRRVDEAVEHLPERQRQIIERAFGLGVAPESIADVAAEFHLSPQRTRTIVLDALHKLERELETLGALMTGAFLR